MYIEHTIYPKALQFPWKPVSSCTRIVLVLASFGEREEKLLINIWDPSFCELLSIPTPEDVVSLFFENKAWQTQ